MWGLVSSADEKKNLAGIWEIMKTAYIVNHVWAFGVMPVVDGARGILVIIKNFWKNLSDPAHILLFN